MQNPIDPWAHGDALTAAHLQQQVEVINQISALLGGDGLETMRTPGGSTVRATPQPAVPGRIVTVSPDLASPVSGSAGLYGGSSSYSYQSGTSTFSPGNRSDLILAASADVDGVDRTCYALNLLEFDASGAGATIPNLHYLGDANAALDGNSVLPLNFIGFLTGAMSDDDVPLPLVLFWAIPFETCA